MLGILKKKFVKTFKPTNKICKLKSRIFFFKENNKFISTNNFLFFASGISIKKK